MLENILNVKGAKALSKSDQKEVLGGMPQLILCCDPALQCCVQGHSGCHSGTGHPNCSYAFPTSANPCCI